ncbi:hypothetical protein K469DRAFT_811239 [Zopfia rhizophila CBS 207.26]|uniref:Uncharacterized protein n=1 Tax=Zopfia rhizophila CBS 207.26 TaxID=1314779 RepID=A0A6A6EIM1_9PEZI|nr:hypothetical protein K469DRAFT_811239 [Zopfia rhizophila CBS 207.26]
MQRRDSPLRNLPLPWINLPGKHAGPWTGHPAALVTPALHRASAAKRGCGAGSFFTLVVGCKQTARAWWAVIQSSPSRLWCLCCAAGCNEASAVEKRSACDRERQDGGALAAVRGRLGVGGEGLESALACGLKYTPSPKQYKEELA